MRGSDGGRLPARRRPVQGTSRLVGRTGHDPNRERAYGQDMDVSDQGWLGKLAEAYDVPPDVLAVGAGIFERLRGSTYAVIAIHTLGDLPAEFRMIMRFLTQIAVRSNAAFD